MPLRKTTARKPNPEPPEEDLQVQPPRPASGRTSALGRRVEKPGKPGPGGPSGQKNNVNSDPRHTNR